MLDWRSASVPRRRFSSASRFGVHGPAALFAHLLGPHPQGLLEGGPHPFPLIHVPVAHMVRQRLRAGGGDGSAGVANIETSPPAADPNSCGFYDLVEGRTVGPVDDHTGVGHRDRLGHVGAANSDPVDLAVHRCAPHLSSQGPQAASDERMADVEVGDVPGGRARPAGRR